MHGQLSWGRWESEEEGEVKKVKYFREHQEGEDVESDTELRQEDHQWQVRKQS